MAYIKKPKLTEEQAKKYLEAKDESKRNRKRITRNKLKTKWLTQTI